MTTSIPLNSTPESIAGAICAAGISIRGTGVDAAAFPLFQLAIDLASVPSGGPMARASAPVEGNPALPVLPLSAVAAQPAGSRLAQFFPGERAETTARPEVWSHFEPEAMPPGMKPAPDTAPAAPATREQAEATAAMMASLWQLLGLLSRPATPDAAPELTPDTAGAEVSPAGTQSAVTVGLMTGFACDRPAWVVLPAGWGQAEFLHLAVAGQQAMMPSSSLPARESVSSALAAPTAAPAEVAATEVTPRVAAANGSAGEKATIAIVLDAMRTIRLEAVLAAPGPGVRLFTPAQGEGLVTGTEKIAAPKPGKSPMVDAARPVLEKKFLVTGADGDGNPPAGAGIAHATGRGDMLPNSHSGKLAVDQAVGLQAQAQPAESLSGPMGDMHEFHPSLVAQRAVAAVARIIDIQTTSRLQPVPSVQIRMTLGGEDLAIKVELHGGTVQTQFRTASAELCQAIAQQWSAVKSESPERSMHFLDPVFVTAGDEARAETAGDFSQQGHTSQHPGQPAETEIFGAPGRSYPYQQNGPAAGLADSLSPLPPTSLHLSAVA